MRSLKLSEKRILMGAFFFCVTVIVLLSLIGDKGVLQLQTIKQQERELIQEIKDLKRQQKEWLRQVESLKTNRTYIETVAREDLGLIADNETLLKVVSPTPPLPESTP